MKNHEKFTYLVLLRIFYNNYFGIIITYETLFGKQLGKIIKTKQGESARQNKRNLGRNKIVLVTSVFHSII